MVRLSINLFQYQLGLCGSFKMAPLPSPLNRCGNSLIQLDLRMSSAGVAGYLYPKVFC